MMKGEVVRSRTASWRRAGMGNLQVTCYSSGSTARIGRFGARHGSLTRCNFNCGLGLIIETEMKDQILFIDSPRASCRHRNLTLSI